MYSGFAILFLIIALILFFQSGKQRKSSGLPGGRIIYTDTSKWGPVEDPLYDPVARITGRPDYLLRQGNTVIPIEVKSGRVPDAPYDSHIYQLAAYCMLVERQYGIRPPYGLIHYGKRTFAVDYTEELEETLLDLLTEMRRVERRKSVDRSHEQTARCSGCGFAYTCEQNL